MTVPIQCRSFSDQIHTITVHATIHTKLYYRYELMTQCWSVERENRPTFTRLKMRLKALAIAMGRKEVATRDGSVLYEDTYYVNQNMGPSQ